MLTNTIITVTSISNRMTATKDAPERLPNIPTVTVIAGSELLLPTVKNTGLNATIPITYSLSSFYK